LVRHQPPCRPDQKAVVLGVLLLVVLGLVVLGGLGGEHLPRVFFACLSAGAGWVVGVSLARRRPLRVRMGWVAAGLLGALAVRWFMPTTDGVSLWDAARMASATDFAPGDNAQRYRRTVAERRFPEYAGEIAAAESAWLRRRVDGAIRDADRLLLEDPVRASESLRGLARELCRLQRWGEVRNTLLTARQRVVLDAVKAVHAELEAQLNRGDPAGVADTAGRLVDAPDGLATEAREVGVWDDARRQLADVRTRALRSRLKAAEERLGATLARGEYTVVADGARDAAAELGAEAKVVGLEGEVRDRLRAVRRQAVRACLEAARHEVAALLARDRFQAIAALGERLGKVMREEAEAVGEAGELEQLRQGCAVLGELARPAGRADPK
jgi:hypothetical protein